MSAGRDRTGRRKARLAVALGTVIIATGFAVAALLLRDRPSARPMTVATGPPCSPYDRLGRAIAGIVDISPGGAGANTLSTTGSEVNTILLTLGDADFGFVYDRTPTTPFSELRTVARLPDDLLQIVVRDGLGIDTAADLDGRPVGLGACGTAERRLAESVLVQHGIHPDAWPDCTLTRNERLRRPPYPPVSLEAEVFVGGLPNHEVARGLERPGMGRPDDRPATMARPEYGGCTPGERRLDAPAGRLLPLSDRLGRASSLEGIGLVVDGVRPSHIPASTYGSWPTAPADTVSVGVLLVAGRTVPDDVVEKVARALFEHRFALGAVHPEIAGIEELTPETPLRFPLHPGAEAFYTRDRPHPLVRWAEPMSLAVALIAAAGSGFFALRRGLRLRKKNRIDVYYLELESISDRLGRSESAAAMAELRARLLDLRKRAFEELVAERLNADESFAIFESSLSHRLAEIERRDQELGSTLTFTRLGCSGER